MVREAYLVKCIVGYKSAITPLTRGIPGEQSEETYKSSNISPIKSNISLWIERWFLYSNAITIY